MTHARYLYCPPRVGLQYDEATKSFSMVFMDLGVIIPVILVMASFWATSIFYPPFLDDFDDILASLLMEI